MLHRLSGWKLCFAKHFCVLYSCMCDHCCDLYIWTQLHFTIQECSKITIKTVQEDTNYSTLSYLYIITSNITQYNRNKTWISVGVRNDPTPLTVQICCNFFYIAKFHLHYTAIGYVAAPYTVILTKKSFSGIYSSTWTLALTDALGSKMTPRPTKG